MDFRDNIFSFPLPYGGNIIDCDVIMFDNYYEIYFDGEYYCTMELDENCEWRIEAGRILPADIVDEIGIRIQDRYT